MRKDPFGYTVSKVHEALRQQFYFVLEWCGKFWTGSADLWTALACSGRLWEALGSVLDGFGRFWEALEGSGWALAGLWTVLDGALNAALERGRLWTALTGSKEVWTVLEGSGRFWDASNSSRENRPPTFGKENDFH